MYATRTIRATEAGLKLRANLRDTFRRSMCEERFDSTYGTSELILCLVEHNQDRHETTSDETCLTGYEVAMLDDSGRRSLLFSSDPEIWRHVLRQLGSHAVAFSAWSPADLPGEVVSAIRLTEPERLEYWEPTTW